MTCPGKIRSGSVMCGFAFSPSAALIRSSGSHHLVVSLAINSRRLRSLDEAGARGRAVPLRHGGGRIQYSRDSPVFEARVQMQSGQHRDQPRRQGTRMVRAGQTQCQTVDPGSLSMVRFAIDR